MAHCDWKYQARQALGEPNYPAAKFALAHTGTVAALSLVLTGISILLPLIVGADGGLGAMGVHTFITAIQMVLPLLAAVFGIFWNVGLQRAALSYAQSRQTGPADLPEGFRRWKPVFTSSLVMGVQYLIRGVVAVFLSSQLLAFTPWAIPIYKAALQQMKDPSLDINVLLAEHSQSISIAYGVLFLVVFVALALPVYYRYRMTNFVILENPELGGLRALLLSRMLTYRKRMRLLRLDLQFWWFYALEIAIAALCYGDVILQAFGVTLPISADLASWLFLLAGALAQLGLHCAAKPWLETAFAKAYDTLIFELENPQEQEEVPQTGKSHPWEY